MSTLNIKTSERSFVIEGYVEIKAISDFSLYKEILIVLKMYGVLISLYKYPILTTFDKLDH